MSYEASACCWGPRFPVETELPVSPQTIRLVALAMADVVNDMHHNEFYGSITQLAKKAGIGRETAGLAVKHLRTVGVIKLLQHRPGGSNRYQWIGVPETPDLTERSVTYLTEPSVTPCRNVPSLYQERPISIPSKFIGGKPPSCDSSQEKEELDVEYGRDPDKPRVIDKKPKGRVQQYRDGEDLLPATKGPDKDTTLVMAHMDALWMEVVTAIPGYAGHKCMDPGGFARYLNKHFFDEGCPNPMSSDEVRSIVTRFMTDLKKRRFRLKEDQACWMAFTGRWHNYPVKAAKPDVDRPNRYVV